jgi:manganese/zinc/iron transport system permease protein
VKQDAAMGIAFSTLFAIWVVLTALYADKVDLDAECVLYGEIGYVPMDVLSQPVTIGGVTVGSPAIVRMAAVLVGVALLIVCFYKELLVSSFDAGLARSLGINPKFAHFGLMGVLSIVVVSAFESVGAILVIAMLILPGATAALLTKRLPYAHLIAIGHAALSAVLGTHLGVWLDCSLGAAMVVAGTMLFVAAWILSPGEGLITYARRALRPAMQPES